MAGSRESLHIAKLVVLTDSAATTAATVTSAALDTLGFEGTEIFVPVVAWTAGTYTFKLTECDTVGGSYTDVDAGQVAANALWTGTLKTGVAAKSVLRAQYLGYKRFVQTVVTGASSQSANFGIMALLTVPRETF